MTDFDPFSDDVQVLGFDDEMTEAAASIYPNMHQLVGRLLLVRPLSFELVEDQFNKGGKPKPRWEADVVVLTGDPIVEKIDVSGFDKTSFDTPIVPGVDAPILSGMYISQVGLVRWLKAKKAAPNYDAKPWILGRLARTAPAKPGQAPGYTFGDPNRAKGVPPYSPEDVKLATAWLQNHPQ